MNIGDVVPRRSFLRASAGLLLVAALGRSVARAQAAPLRMAVHPYTSTLALVATHQPLQLYLERTLQRPVEFFTAASFDAYLAALMAGEYDIVITPPHFAVLALEREVYVPLVHYSARLEPFLVVRQDSPYHRAADFVGKRIAMADQTAFIRLVMLKKLADAGLVPGKHFQVVERPTHGAAILATLQGEVDAGVAMGTVLRLQPDAVRKQLRTVLGGHSFPNLFTLAHRNLGEHLIGRIRAALHAFAKDPAGRAFFEKTGYGGYAAIAREDTVALTPYAEMARPLIAPAH